MPRAAIIVAKDDKKDSLQNHVLGSIMSKKKNEVKAFIYCGIILSIIGVVMVILYLLDVFADDTLSKVCIYGGIALLFGGVLFALAACADVYDSKKKEPEERSQPESMPQPQPYPQPVPQAVPAQETECAPPVEENVHYFPSEDAYQLVNLGPKQTIEEKFNEIAKMDRAQFVIYIAKLFAIKGYQVKYTPVIDNYDIDLIVEKMDVVIAVGCILTNKVLSDGDIRCVAEGRRHYNANNVMVLTNMYYDRTALNFAKQEQMSLVDRNILAEDFMK